MEGLRTTFKTKEPFMGNKYAKAEVVSGEESVDILYENGDSYLGPVKIGEGAKDGEIVYVRHGEEGTYTFEEGDIYIGPFNQGHFEGKGMYTSIDGDDYTGTFVLSKPNGQGIANISTVPNVISYEGNWRDGIPTGQGKLNFQMGDFYEGQFENGQFHGKGTMFFTNEDAYEGTYHNGIPQGDGQMIFKGSNVIQRRVFTTQGVDRASSGELRFNTYDIKRNKNLRLKEYKQSKKNTTIPKRAKASKVSGKRLGGVKVSRGKSSVVSRKISKKSQKQLKKVKKSSRLTNAQKVAKFRREYIPEYGIRYNTIKKRDRLNTRKIRETFEEIEEQGLKRSKSIEFTIEKAKQFLFRRAQERQEMDIENRSTSRITRNNSKKSLIVPENPPVNNVNTSALFASGGIFGNFGKPAFKPSFSSNISTAFLPASTTAIPHSKSLSNL